MFPGVVLVTKQRWDSTYQHRQDIFIKSNDTTKNGLGRKNETSEFGDLTTNTMPSSQSVKVMSYCRVVEASTSRYIICPSGILRRQRSLDISAGEQALYLVDRASKAGYPRRGARRAYKS